MVCSYSQQQVLVACSHLAPAHESRVGAEMKAARGWAGCSRPCVVVALGCLLVPGLEQRVSSTTLVLGWSGWRARRRARARLRTWATCTFVIEDAVVVEAADGVQDALGAVGEHEPGGCRRADVVVDQLGGISPASTSACDGYARVVTSIPPSVRNITVFSVAKSL